MKADLYLENKGAKIWTPYFVIGSLLEAKNGFMSSNLMTLPQTNKPSSAGVEPQCPDEDGGSGITGSFESLLPPPWEWGRVVCHLIYWEKHGHDKCKLLQTDSQNYRPVCSGSLKGSSGSFRESVKAR